MKIVERHDILAIGKFARCPAWKRACEDVERAVTVVDWPRGTGLFTIRPVIDGNGVTPIKIPCIEKLGHLGWAVECLPEIDVGVLQIRKNGKICKSGDLDALLRTDKGYIGFEWETGNVSSSHRAINKLLLTMKLGGIKGAILVVPSRSLYRYLTQRIGNIDELRPYFLLWSSTLIEEGAFRILAVEHDATSLDAPPIKKGNDGRSRARRKKKPSKKSNF